MTNDYDGIISKITNILFENACTSFLNTEQYKKLSENHMIKLNNYESVLSDQQATLVNEYLTALNELNTAEKEYIYAKGFEDCFHIFRKTGVL